METNDEIDPAGVGTAPELLSQPGAVRVVRAARPSRRRRRLLGVGSVLTNLLLVVAVAGSLLFAAGTLSGRWSLRTVLTGSMTPAIERGDVVIASPVEVSQVHVGDVILFRSPVDGRTTVHRVDAIQHDADGRLLRTRGDANDASDPWRLRLRGDTVHRVRTVVPGLGGLIRAVDARAVHLLLAIGSASVVTVVGLFSIWAPDGAPARRRRSTRRRVESIAAATAAAAGQAPLVHARRTAGHGARRRSSRLVGTVAVLTAVCVGGLVVRAEPASAAFLPSTTAAGSVGSGQLAVPGSPSCRWASATTLTLNWTANSSGLETGTRVTRADTSGGATTTLATTTPVSVATSTVTALAPVTTNRFYQLRTVRNTTWTSMPTAELRSDGCFGAIRAFAGNGTAGATGDGAAATAAALNQPRGLAVSAAGTTYIADTANNRIRAVDAAGVITTVAGGPAASACSYTGPVSGLGLNAPRDVAVDAVGNVFIADTGANCVRRIDLAGTVTSVAGGGATTACATTGASTAVSLSAPSGVAVDAAGAVYIADTTRNCVRKVVAGTFSQVAGGGATTGCATTGAATAVSLSGPIDVAVDGAGAVYVADTGNSCVRKIAGGLYSAAIGGGATTTCTAAAATAVSLSVPEGVAVDAAGVLYVVDTGRRCVRRVEAGASTLLAMTGVSSSIGDGGPAVAATSRTPSGVAVNAVGDVLVSDRSSTAGSNRVRLVVDP